MNIFEEARKLCLPLGEYVIVGSGPLAAHGLRNFNDVDLVVTERIFGQLRADGWEQTTGPEDRPCLKKDMYEVFKDLRCRDYRPETKRLIEEAEIIDGIPFLRLEELARFKKTIGREKDLRDVQLIETYLENLKR